MLVNLYEGPLYGFVLGRGIDEDSAVDITQETFIKAFQSIENFDGRRASFKTWLYTIAYNQIRDEARRASVQARHREEQKRDLKVGIQASMAGPEQQCLDRDEAHRLLESLDEDSRSIVGLKFWSGFSYDEIAQIAGMARASVRSKVHRALKKMRKHAKNEEEGEGEERL